MKRREKFLAWLLALNMVFTSLPGVVIADGVDEPAPETVEATVTQDSRDAALSAIEVETEPESVSDVPEDEGDTAAPVADAEPAPTDVDEPAPADGET
ncbi:MAG: hypothetical protein IJ048_01010, partial [Clostridia bacterium]|nr:hypothetical protein [Clostridia bacterium]